MSAFNPPFQTSDVQYVDDVEIALPDPPRTPDAPINRPGVARYVGANVIMLHVVPVSPGGEFDVSSPVKGAVREVDLSGSAAESALGISTLFEIEPLAFGMIPELSVLRSGSPTFYLGFTGAPSLPDDDQLSQAGELLGATTGDAFIGLCFQDGMVLSPWSWIELLGKAMEDAGNPAGAAAWNVLNELYGSNRRLRLLDQQGRPVGPGQSVTVTVEGTPGTVLTDANSEIILSPSTDIEISWEGNPEIGDTALSVYALYEKSLFDPDVDAFSRPPGNGGIVLPPDFARGHLQLLDLSRWYASPPSDSIAARFHPGCRVEPLVDGVASFKRILDDLIVSRGSGGSAYFSGLIFNNFEIDEGRAAPEDAAESFDTTLVELTKYIRQGGGEVRMQFDKFLQLKDPDAFLDDTQRAAYVAILMGMAGVGVVGSFYDKFKDKFPFDPVGFPVFIATPLIVGIILELIATTATLESIIEPSIDVFGTLNGLDDPYTAIWARHPVTMADNPLADTSLVMPGFRIADIQDRFGSWHQKIQAIKRIQPDSAGNTVVGFIGGIDINKNRLDSPGHQKASPYHDVHSRVTGTAAWDIHQTWRERYQFEKQQYASIDGDDEVPELTASLPNYELSPEVYPAQSQKHLVQIGRTYPQLNTPLPFSDNGEKTTYNTYLRAIREARDYIYLEDQYFTPNTSPDVEAPPGARNPAAFLDALLEAAQTCKRLVIIVPREGDQPFGQHRRGYVFGLLRDAWEDRIFIGAPLRRPFLSDPGRVAAKGRVNLLDNITESTEQFRVGPPARVGKAPLWLWINGELMLCKKISDTIVPPDEATPYKELTVVRAGSTLGDPKWGAKARRHFVGDPVTFSQLKGPYVHAKVIMVDDIFVGIGSTNISRRAFFHEGEIHAFAIPEQLRAAPDNPAFALRTALWAEHLGLPPAMGASLLGDPMMAFELFRRSLYAANRSVPIEIINELPHLASEIDPDEDAILKVLKNIFGISVAAYVPTVWNTLSDATTGLDPVPVPGPFD